MLSEFLDKITSYNLFNYLLPGAVFAYFAESRLEIKLVPDDLVTAAFVYYFLGVVISRFGSLVLEPLLKKLRVVRAEPYKAFLSAAENDSKIEVLLEAANMYRTFLSAMMILLLLAAYAKIETAYPFLLQWRGPISGFALVLVFLFAYKKQMDYIVDRIRALNG
jgi:sterol desaturase/sphingolipid hydroxylase (fatty acid hydroxylase superfamily)